MAKKKKVDTTTKNDGKISLNVDWDALMPGDDLEIGGQTIVIKPLGLFSLGLLIKQVKGLGKILSAEGVTWENYNLPENIIKIAVVIVDNVPSALSDASGIAMEDIKRLSLDYNVLILDKVFDVNLKSKESLEKNFSRLAEKFKAATTQKSGK